MDANILDPRKLLDLADSSRRHDFVTHNYYYEARIKTADSDILDKYTVDVYELGFRFPATRNGLDAYATNVAETYEVGELIRVRILSDNVCLIVTEKMIQLVQVMWQDPDGGDDYTDNRYWGRFAHILNSDSSPLTDAVIISAYTGDLEHWITFTDINGSISGHTALANRSIDWAYVIKDYDNSAPRRKRWILLSAAEPDHLLWVTLNKSSGDNGFISGSTVVNATYKYDVMDIDDNVLATDVSPIGIREQGPLVGPATQGVVLPPNFNIIWCDERAAVQACTPP